MLIRIVKMSFHEEHIPVFLENFYLNKDKIRNATGNCFLELYQDKDDSNIFFTYSHWNTENDLNNYRKSELFGEVWTFTKKLFKDKPEAWSLNNRS